MEESTPQAQERADALNLIALRGIFFRRNYRFLILICSVLVVAVALETWAMVYALMHPPRPRYFLVDRFARIFPEVPPSQANLSDEQLIDWVGQAVRSLYNYNSRNYKKAINEMSSYFTRTGWYQYTLAWKNSNNLEAVKERQLVVSAVFNKNDIVILDRRDATHRRSSPSVLAKHVPKDVYYWVVKLPVTMLMQGYGYSKSFQYDVLLLVTRVPAQYSIYGVGIEQFIAKQMDA